MLSSAAKNKQTNKPDRLYRALLSKVLHWTCYVAAGMAEESGGEWLHVYIPLLSTWNYHNIVNHLHSNVK